MIPLISLGKAHSSIWLDYLYLSQARMSHDFMFPLHTFDVLKHMSALGPSCFRECQRLLIISQIIVQLRWHQLKSSMASRLEKHWTYFELRIPMLTPEQTTSQPTLLL